MSFSGELALPAMFARSAEPSADIGAIVKRESGSLLDYFNRRCSNADDAADLLGETLIVVWRRRSAVPADPLQARMWLFGVARKVLSGHRRSSRRRTALTLRLGEELASEVSASPVDDPAGEYVRACIRELSDLDQEIIRLVYWDGFSLEETAQILGAKSATIRSRHSRARARLKAMLLASGGSE